VKIEFEFKLDSSPPKPHERFCPVRASPALTGQSPALNFELYRDKGISSDSTGSSRAGRTGTFGHHELTAIMPPLGCRGLRPETLLVGVFSRIFPR